MTNFDIAEKKYLSEIAKQFPTRNAVAAEIIRLNALLNLPKGTEHFLSDIHGEWEAFSHIRRNASGVIRNKVSEIFSDEMSDGEISELASLIYYPSEKLDGAKANENDISKGIAEIHDAIVNGIAAYTLKYSVRTKKRVLGIKT